jgi:hypothetical protein
MTQQEVAEKLLFPLFRSIENGYKEKYKRDVWDQFENALRAASYTAKLSAFFENISKRLPFIPLEVQYLASINEVLSSGIDKQVLNWLRDETSYLTLLTRMINEERKKLYKEEQERKEQAAETDDLTGII